MKKLLLSIFLLASVVACFAQDKENRKTEKKDAKRQKISDMIKQAEEGVLVYNKHSIFGIQARTNGYGIFYELGRAKTQLRTTLYRIDFTEIKDQKETKLSTGDGLFFGNPFVYGKVNNFYQLTLGIGQQRILGQKGNKNGVAVSVIANGGLAVGLLRPYYLEVRDPNGGANKTIKYSEADRNLFLDEGSIVGGAGLGKGWSEMKIQPGAFAKAALRFDYGRFNELVSGIEVGLSADFYGSKITILADQKDKNLFMQGYIAILFGKRK